MLEHVHVPVLVVLLSLCCVLIAGTPQNGNQQAARDIAEQFTEMMERRNLEIEADKASYRPKAERMMRAHNRLSKRYKQKLEESRKRHLERNAMALMALGDKSSDVVLRELEALQHFKRADIDPNCGVEITCDDTEIYRTADGTCNNLENPLWGSAGIQHLRLLTNAYRNGIWVERQRSVTSGRGVIVELPTARDISNAVHRYEGEDDGTDTPVRDDVSQMLWAWGQFLAHDIVETPEGDIRSVNCCDSDTGNSQFCMPIEIDAGDPYFTDGICMAAVRSFTVLPCDDDFQNQINDITSYIDASNVYGSSDEETAELRSFTGGFLKTSTSNFPPNDTSDDAICDRQETGYCAKSESRANVVPSLTTLHTVFVREHNRIADYLNDINPDWSDETVFQETRKIVAAEMQHITYNQFLPTMLSEDTMTNYRLTTPSDSYSYESGTDSSLIQAFSIAFRGHSMIPPSMKFFNTEYETVDAVVPATNTYLHPHYLFWNNYGAIDEIARWVVGGKCPMADRYMESTARNELFQDGGLGFDLATLNIQRGREWGTPSYTEYRSYCGLADDVTDWDWDSLTDHDDDAITALQSVYADPEDIDLYTGIASETHLGSSVLGPTGSCLVAMQFETLKYGDRFWYETSETSSDGNSLGFTSKQLNQIQKVTLSKILCDNLDIPYIQENAFQLGGDLVECGSLQSMNLDRWSDATRK